jgi:outer membrane lipoprotein-sorting protein
MSTSFHKNQRGLGQVLIVVLIVVILGVGGTGYYVWSKQKDKTSSTGTTSQALVSDQAVADACNKVLSDKDFCRFASNWKSLENFKSTLSTSGKNGSSIMTVEAESSDRSKVVIMSEGKETAAYITIGDASYIKDVSDGSWTKFTGNSASSASEVKDGIKIDDFSDSSSTDPNKIQYKKVTKEACGSLTCFKYQIIDPSSPDIEQFVWFDTKDYLLRRWTHKGAEGTTDMSVSYDKVKISEPSPIKSTTDTSNNTMPSQAEIEAAIQAAQAAGSEE